MTEKELWAEFCSKKNIDINTPYEAWGFGGVEESDTDKLAELVLQGKKLGTASSYDEYVLEDITDEIPMVGDYSVLLNSKDDITGGVGMVIAGVMNFGFWKLEE